MFNTIIEIKRENKEGQLNIKINLYHNNEEELNKIVKATNKFKFYNDTTITNNDGSLSYTKATNVMTINNVAEELLDFDNNIKELKKLFIEVGAEPLILEGYLRATDKKEYKEDMEKAGNNQNVEENTKNNNMEMEKNVIIKVTGIERDIFKSGKIVSLEGITKHNKIVGIGNIKDIMNHDYFFPYGTYLKVSYDAITFHKDIIYTIKATNIMPMKIKGNRLVIDNDINKYYDILD